MKIAVTSGYARSRHAIAVIARLARAGHDVGLCLNVRMFTPARLLAYSRQYGAGLLGIFLRRAIPVGSGRHAEVRYIEDDLRSRGIAYSTVRAACRAVGARYLPVAHLNHRRALGALSAFSPDLLVYCGGGILRRALLAIPRLGAINAHGGPLPRIRGMNAAEWALLHGLVPAVAVHFVDAGVDTGPILFQRPQPVDPSDTIADVRGKAVVLSVECLVHAVDEIDAGRATPVPQRTEEGAQHFMMHPLMLEIVQDWMARGLTPARAPGGPA